MFRRTLKTIDSETDGRSPWTLVAGILVLGPWLYWFTSVPVTVAETSKTARVEVTAASFPVDAPVEGSVVAVPLLVLGRRVAAGDALLEVDATALRLELAEARARESAVGPELAAAETEIAADEAALRTDKSRGVSSVDEARGRRSETAVLAQLARSEADRLQRLYRSGTISESELTRGLAEADRRAGGAAAVDAEVRLRSHSASVSKSDREAGIASLQRTAAALRGALAIQRARIASLEHEIALRTIHAPAAGVIGEIGRARIGSVIKAGERVATIVDGDDLRLVADFPPAAVFGRVHVGQKAQFRLEGFSWIEYGLPRATVTRVASEVHDGLARVELRIDDRSAGRVPMQHGQPGEITVEVERKTPWRLLQSLVGRAIAPDRRAAVPLASRAP